MTHERVAFANQLRGLAALCVVVIHYTIVYQLMRPAVAWVIAAPAYEGPPFPAAAWLFPPWFDAGAFGVGVFFLISGFVIPFSLAGTSALRFLAARALRIFPTFWAALAVEWATVGAGASYWGRPIVFGWQTFLYNALLVNTLAGTGFVDWVSWTLSVEIKFYLLMAVLRPLVLAHRVWPLVLVAGLCAAFVAGATGRLSPVLVDEASYIPVMLAGTLFHYHYRGALGTGRVLAGGAVLAGAFALCWAHGPNAALWPQKPANYLYALLLFGLCYASRHRIGRLPLLDGLAAISYPLYLIHSVFGFSVMSFLIIAWGWTYLPAALLAFALSAVVAWGLHRAVERPSIRAGHEVARGGRPALDLQGSATPAE